MTAEENKDLIRRYIAALNKPNWMDLIEEFMQPEHIGLFIEEHLNFRRAFPDYHFFINEIIVEGNKTVVVGTVHATQEGDFPYGEFKFVPASGRPLQWKEIWIGTIVDGKLGDGFIMIDVESRMTQLGLVCVHEKEIHPEE